MEGFSKCPRCGDIDVQRTRCACGYTVGAAENVSAEQPTPTAEQAEEARARLEQFHKDLDARLEARAKAGGGLERIGGLLLLLAGAVLSYTCVYQPLAAADRQEKEISVSLKGAIFCPLAVGLGLAYLLLGKSAKAVFGTREKPSPLVYVVAVLLVLVGLGLYAYIRGALEAKGYQF
jgi:hypothetical protein